MIIIEHKKQVLKLRVDPQNKKSLLYGQKSLDVKKYAMYSFVNRRQDGVGRMCELVYPRNLSREGLSSWALTSALSGITASPAPETGWKAYKFPWRGQSHDVSQPISIFHPPWPQWLTQHGMWPVRSLSQLLLLESRGREVLFLLECWGDISARGCWWLVGFCKRKTHLRMTPVQREVSKATKRSGDMIPADITEHPGTALPEAINI